MDVAAVVIGWEGSNNRSDENAVVVKILKARPVEHITIKCDVQHEFLPFTDLTDSTVVKADGIIMERNK